MLPEYIDTVLVSRVEEVDDGLELVRVHANVPVPVPVSVHVEDDGGFGFVGKGKGKAPVRPRSPSAHERPDLSVFVRQAVPRAPPAILVRGGREGVGSRGSGSGAGKRVQFDV
jgi:aminoglycoside phosphotransferase (APT) family kinase protein